MNLTEALNAALPELPVRKAKLERLPALDPHLITRVQIEAGQPIVMVLVPDTHDYYRVTPEQWALLQLFDGQRSYAEIADMLTARTNQLYDENHIQDFAEQLKDSQFWYRTPQEKNIALMEKMMAERRERTAKKSKFGNLAEIRFSAWDPNSFLDWAYSKLRFIYAPWFVLSSLVVFALMFCVFAANWREIWNDTLGYYTFTEKSFSDIVEFWLLVCILGFLHESSHGLSCKHTGGEVHQMGFLLIYLTPCFFCDVSEAWVYGGKWMRIATMMSGIWVEMLVCAVSTFVWWGTPPGATLHDVAYKVVLMTGIIVPLVNLNPLIKLDGYFVFTELFEITELKERSTALLSGWVKKNSFGLPVEIEYVPSRLRLFFVIYALLSGLYSYSLLYFVVRFGRNIFYRFSPEWAFLPATFLFLMLFKSRIRTFSRFMNTVYLDKKDRILRLWTPMLRFSIAPAILLLFFFPVWRETVEARVSLEPAHRSIVRAEVPGTVLRVLTKEGQSIQSGETIAVLGNLDMASEAAVTNANLQVASARATQAQMNHRDYGPAEHEWEQLAEQSRLLHEREAQLTLNSPIAGTVVTARLQDAIGSRLKAGATLAEISDMSVMQARMYVPETEIRKVHVGSPASIFVTALGKSYTSSLASLAPAASDLVPDVRAKHKYQGIRPPQFYEAIVLIPNADRSLREGMSGTGKVFVKRRSAASLTWETLTNFAGRKLW
jgi:putative peptide zinc metalloprotease protein